MGEGFDSTSYVTGGVIKRFFDIVGASALLLLAMPLMLLVAFAIWLLDGGPILFRHGRVGKDDRVFRCMKFRTMRTNAEALLEDLLKNDPEARRSWEVARKLENDPRIIPGIGAFLRKTSLDELPQLFNVLRGEMSLVGPRPVTREELEYYKWDVGYYLSARPGLTGAWQVSGRNDLSFDERVKLDTNYVLNATILTDVGIILRTPMKVLNGSGAY